MITIEIPSDSELRKDLYWNSKEYTKKEYVDMVLPILVEEAEKRLKKFLEKEHDSWKNMPS